MNGGSLEPWVKHWLTPRGFFVGVVLGFLSCCVLGRQLVKVSAFLDFEFLNAFISPDSHYYPTALQVRQLARRQLPRDKVAVIIGGNSVLKRTGGNEPWTRHLERELGDEYRVLNLAANGGAPNQYGLLAAEMLSKRQTKIIHVCNIWPTTFSGEPDGSPQYRYAFHDARARGLLLAFPERDSALATRAAQRGKDEELHLQTGANRWCSFNDLWHVAGYEIGFTVWTPNCLEHPWRARKDWRPQPLSAARRADDWPETKSSLLHLSRPWNPADDATLQAQVRESIPPNLRPATLVLVSRASPAYLRKLDREDPGARTRYDQNSLRTVELMRAQQLVAIEIGKSMADEDYRDGVHLTASGGEKLAHELAPEIRATAKRLGYLAEDLP